MASIGNKNKWLFGYGSLLWKVDFEYKNKLVGYVENYRRQFWLLSDDHRGTPENPGRVVTLVPMDVNDNATVLGVAYEIEESKVDETFKYLDFREKCGYTKHEVDFIPLNGNMNFIKCICYYADETNEYYSKTFDNNYIADHIIKSKGPSGTNLEYFFNLCNTLRQLIKKTDDDCDNGNDIYLQHEKHLFNLECVIKENLNAIN